jgi:aminoglycoside phosphotransferase (APT) family kinase protein
MRWISGRDASVASIKDWATTSELLGAFVSGLLEIDTKDGSMSGPESGFRGCPLQTLDSRTREVVSQLSDVYDTSGLIRIWEKALGADAWQHDPVWVHGDIHAANILVQDGVATAVIDFGLMSIGDPACDLAVAWSFIPQEFRQHFLDAAGLDEAAKQRGKGWALYFGAIALSYYRGKNSTLAAIATQAIDAVVTD